MTFLAVVVLAFCSVALVTYGTLAVVFSDDRRVSKRLTELTRYERQEALVAEPMLQPFSVRIVGPVWNGVANRLHRMWPKEYNRSLSEKLQAAGNPRGLTADRMLAGKLAASLGVTGLFTVIGILAGWSLGRTLLAVLVCGGIAFFLPDAWLDGQVRRRSSAIVRELPDMLDMLTISVEAGLGFDAAVSKLVRNSTGPLAEEFGRALQEIQAGSSRKKALKSLGERSRVPELVSFTASMVQADTFGVSIAKVLRTQANEMRLKRRQRAEEAAQKAPVKMVIPLVLCILPATMMVILGPAVVRIAALFM